MNGKRIFLLVLFSVSVLSRVTLSDVQKPSPRPPMPTPPPTQRAKAMVDFLSGQSLSMTAFSSGFSLRGKAEVRYSCELGPNCMTEYGFVEVKSDPNSSILAGLCHQQILAFQMGGEVMEGKVFRVVADRRLPETKCPVPRPGSSLWKGGCVTRPAELIIQSCSLVSRDQRVPYEGIEPK